MVLSVRHRSECVHLVSLAAESRLAAVSAVLGVEGVSLARPDAEKDWQDEPGRSRPTLAVLGCSATREVCHRRICGAVGAQAGAV